MPQLFSKTKIRGQVNYNFAIICYYTGVKVGFNNELMQWQQFESYTNYTNLTPQRAQELIKEHKLELVADNQYGKIWDRI